MKVILLRFGELYLKGHNRNVFENTLIDNIKKMLQGEEFKFEKTFGRYVISDYKEDRENEIVRKLKKVFGLYSLSKAREVEADVNKIKECVKGIDCKNPSFNILKNCAII